MLFEALFLSRASVLSALYCPFSFLLQILSLPQSHQGTHGQFDSATGLGLNVIKMLSNFLLITFSNQCQLVFIRFSTYAALCQQNLHKGT